MIKRFYFYKVYSKKIDDISYCIKKDFAVRALYRASTEDPLMLQKIHLIVSESEIEFPIKNNISRPIYPYYQTTREIEEGCSKEYSIYYNLSGSSAYFFTGYEKFEDRNNFFMKNLIELINGNL